MAARRALVVLIALATLSPWVSPAAALFAGMGLSLALGCTLAETGKAWAPRLLQLSVVGLGGMTELHVIARVGARGAAHTLVSIALTMTLGALLGRALRVGRDTSLLVSSGTAICGGSAIAAVASVLRAKPAEASVALATVFLLNAAALLVFPWLGHAFSLDEHEFGLWSALAIHDTSSVVGAASHYGPRALETATAVKLARALWIIPLCFGIEVLRARHRVEAPREGGDCPPAAKTPRPWFILGFVAVAALVTWVPALAPAGRAVAALARRGLVLSLFLIGCGLTRGALSSVGVRPLLQGALLWLAVSGSTLAAIRAGWIA
jgi:uncharacterized integral membrane protein (TIGR00698 family)